VLRAELLERTGRYSESRILAEGLIKTRRLSLVQRSSCEFSLGLIDWDEGDTDASITHFQRSLKYATSADDPTRICWAALRLMVVQAGRVGPVVTGQALADVRRTIMRAAEPTISAALHILIGEMEAKRGLLNNAVRHTELGCNLLSTAPNLWLEAVAENNHVAICLMRSELRQGLLHAERARQLAEESGAATMRRATLANIGNLHFGLGHLEQAIEYFEMSRSFLPASGEYSNGATESLARAYLLQGDVGRAIDCLDLIEDSILAAGDRTLYANRHALLTWADVHVRQGDYGMALERVRLAVSLASAAGDDLLSAMARIRRAEILATLQRLEEAWADVNEVARTLLQLPAEVFAHYERAVGRLSTADGNRGGGLRHYIRSERVFSGLHHLPGVLEVTRLRDQSETDSNADPLGPGGQAGCNLQEVASLMLHAGRPALLATGIIAILSNTRCVSGAIARARAEDGEVEVLSSFGTVEESPENRTLPLGASGDRTIEVVLQPLPDIEAHVSLNAIGTLLGTVRELEIARAEREDRLTLWPAADLPSGDKGAAASGAMANVMATARRVAPTNVLVLLTGESGTGKDVLARFIHRNSLRAAKPFVPFNCAAVPRELLEGQLFGHRRGSFTGADRDSPGVIRAAKDGTLFLDEIGELGLDLQPKLLRFLESQEINPIGDPTPSRVDARIIAATNADLYHLVQQGRFREDLFYRLNVIHLPIPPLRERREEIPALVHHFIARAAAEFSKGRMRITEEVMEHLLLYDWPGNVRELQNEIRRMVALADGDSVLRPSTIAPRIRRATPKAAAPADPHAVAVSLHDKLPPTISRIEREMITSALLKHHGKVDAVARALGISRKGLYLKRQRLKI
jgi:DNA-binding NtrC family response regulator/tetratricopeptide (TPR) repeat protein